MRTLQLHYKYSYKHKLLYCLLLNYYRRCYSKNKFKGVIAVACFKRPVLMNHYEMFFKTINEFTDGKNIDRIYEELVKLGLV